MCKDEVIWDGRLVKMLDETTWGMSRRGDHEDFDYAPMILSADQAVAGNQSKFVTPERSSHPVVIERIVVIDDRRLLFVGKDGSFWLLTGNPMEDGRIYLLEAKL